MNPQTVRHAYCPKCGKATDTMVGMTDDPDELPMMLYCVLCDHKWINLANLEPPA